MVLRRDGVVDVHQQPFVAPDEVEEATRDPDVGHRAAGAEDLPDRFLGVQAAQPDVDRLTDRDLRFAGVVRPDVDRLHVEDEAVLALDVEEEVVDAVAVADGGRDLGRGRQ